MSQVTVVCEVRQGGSWSPLTGGGQAAPLTLYSGQRAELRLTVTNTGAEPVRELEVEVPPAEGCGAPPLVELDLAPLAAALPLLPGAAVTLPVTLTGQVDASGGGALLRPEDSVSVASDPRWSVSLPSTSASRSLTTTGHPSLVSQASHGSQGEPAPHQLSFRVEYSGEGAWCRRAALGLSVAQLASLQVTRWDVLPGDTQHSCFLVLDLVNKTPHEMELTYAERKVILIEAGDMCRVPVPVTKCSFSESLEWSGGRESGVAAYLAACVSLRWAVTDPTTEEVREGESGLESIMWTDSMVELLRRPPLVAEVVVGGREVPEGGEVEHLAGEPLLVEVRLLNQLLEPVSNCSLSVRLQQEVVGARAGQGAGLAGTPGGGGALGEVAPGGRVEHRTTLLPLTPGLFKLAVGAEVTFRGRPHAWRLAPLAVTVAIGPDH